MYLQALLIVELYELVPLVGCNWDITYQTSH